MPSPLDTLDALHCLPLPNEDCEELLEFFAHTEAAPNTATWAGELPMQRTGTH